MKTAFRTWESYHHQLYTIYHGVIACSLIPFFLIFLEVEVAEIKESKVEKWVEVLLLILLAIVAAVCSWLVWRGKIFLYDFSERTSIKEKLYAFKKLELKRYLLLELVCMLAFAGLWLTSHYLFVILYFAVLVQFSFLRPSEERVVQQLGFTKAERSNLRSMSFEERVQ